MKFRKKILVYTYLIFLCLSFTFCTWISSAQDSTEEDDVTSATFMEEAGKTDPEYRSAREFMNRKQWSPAAEKLRTLVSRHPDSAGYWNDLGICLMKLGKDNEAEQAFLKALKTDPGYFRAPFNLGILKSNRKKPEEAEKAYRTALELNPNFPEGYYNLGLFYQCVNIMLIIRNR